MANTAGVLSIALADAVRLRIIPFSPATDARLPRRAHREMTAWTEGEAAGFLASVVDDRMFPLWRLALATGLRRGELCRLRWKDVDLAVGVVVVASTRVVADAVVTGEPKTKAGARIVALDRDTVAALASWKRRQAQERLAAGASWADSGLVFVDEHGVPRTQRRSLAGGAKRSSERVYHPFASTMPATPRPPSCCGPVCPSRSSPSASATPTSLSPCASINMSPPKTTARPPRRSAELSAGTDEALAAVRGSGQQLG